MTMKTMKAFAGVVSVALMLVGGAACKKNDPMAQMSKFVDKLCACKDQKCAEGVSKEMKDWGDKQDKSKKPSDADMKKAEEMAKKMMDCQTKLMAAAAGGDAPK